MVTDRRVERLTRQEDEFEERGWEGGLGIESQHEASKSLPYGPRIFLMPMLLLWI